MSASAVLAEPSLVERTLALSPKTVGLASRAEIALARADSLIATSPERRTIRLLSSALEAAANQRISHPETLLTQLFHGLWVSSGHESLSHLTARCQAASSDSAGGAGANGPRRQGVIGFAMERQWQEGYEDSLRFTETILWASKYVSPKNRLNAELLLDIQSRILYQRSHHQTAADFRTNSLGAPSLTNLGPATAPEAERVFPLVMELCGFVNSDMYSPLVQAALASCQLEWIAPFGREPWVARALTQLVLYRRGLTRSTILPLNLLVCIVPDASTRLRDASLRPLEKLDDSELLQRLNSLVSLFAGSAEFAAETIFALDKLVAGMLAGWRQRFGRLFKGSLLEEVLSLLFLHPIVSVESLCELTGRSFTTVNDVVTRLSKAGILVNQRADCARSRVFVAEEVLDGYEKLLGRLLPQFLLSSAFKAHLLN